MSFRNANKALKAQSLDIGLGWGQGGKTRLLVKRSRRFAGQKVYYTIGVFQPHDISHALASPEWIRPPAKSDSSPEARDGWDVNGSTWGGYLPTDEQMNMEAPRLTAEQLAVVRDALMLDKLTG